MNESIILADNAVLHILLRALGKAGVVDRSRIYRDAISVLEELADQQTDHDMKDVIHEAANYLIRHDEEKVDLYDQLDSLLDEPPAQDSDDESDDT